MNSISPLCLGKLIYANPKRKQESLTFKLVHTNDLEKNQNFENSKFLCAKRKICIEAKSNLNFEAFGTEEDRKGFTFSNPLSSEAEYLPLVPNELQNTNKYGLIF